MSSRKPRPPFWLLALGGLAIAVPPALALFGTTRTAHAAIPAPKFDVPADAAPTQTAILSGGCFWGIQGVFEHVAGVTRVVAGYDGGAAATAQYELVSTGTTGHAESVEIVFDPRRVSYGKLLRIFFSVALDPTQVNAQFPDEGTQYRSELFTTSPEQQHVASAYIAQLNAARAFAHPIATRVDPDHGFYAAEDYHQDYLVLHPDSAYIAAYDLPKVTALRKSFAESYVQVPVTLHTALAAR